MANSNLDDVVDQDELKAKQGHKNAAAKKAKNNMKKAAKKAKTQLVKTMGTRIFSWIAPAFLIIFLLIGMVSFLYTMPGLMEAGIESAARDLIEWLEGIGRGDDYDLKTLNSSEDKLAIAKYLDEMGYDPVGFGFAYETIRETVETQDKETNNEQTDSNIEENAEATQQNGKIKYVSDSYNTVSYIHNWTDRISDDWLDYILNADFMDVFEHGNETLEGNTYLGNQVLYKYMVSNERMYMKQSKTLIDEMDGIATEQENGSATGWIPSGMLKFVGDTNLTDIEIDRENKELTIFAGTTLFGGDTFKYNLDGWAGRYGLPLEMILALHLGTMTNELTSEMITADELQTTVNIALNQAECDLAFQFIQDGKEIQMDAGDPESKDNFFAEISDNIQYNSLTGEFTYHGEKFEKGSKSLVQLFNTMKIIKEGGLTTFIRTSDALETINTFLGEIDEDNGNYYQYIVQESFARTDLEINTIKNTTLSMPYVCQIHEDSIEPIPETGVLKYLGEANAYRVVNSTTDETYSFWFEEDQEALENIKVGRDKIGKMYSAKGYNTPDILIAIPYGVECSKDVEGEDGFLYRQRSLKEIRDVIKAKQEIEDNLTTQKYTAAEMVQINKKFTDIIENANKGNSMIRMAIQIDINFANEEKNSNLKFSETFNNDEGNEEQYPSFDEFDEMIDGDPTLYNVNYVYTKKMEKVLDKIESSDYDGALIELDNMITQLQSDYEIWVGIDTTRDEIINKIIKDLGYDGLTYEMLKEIMGFLIDKLNKSKTVTYVEPRIESVIKHWYKDIDYSEAYKLTSEPEILPYTGEGSDTAGMQINVVLTPTNGSLNDQNTQPYVIKGDVVTLGGKLQENMKPGTYDGYTLGDGYRTTKKLFTQSYYYTFDGTEETTHSIAIAKYIESLPEGEIVLASISNGRFNTAVQVPSENMREEMYSDGKWNIEAEIDEDRKKDFTDNYENSNGEKKPIKYENDYWSICLGKATTKDGIDVDIYCIKIKKSLEYKTILNNSYEETKKSAERINNLLTILGVVTQRKPISFDNATANSDVITMSAFSILEGMHTTDGELIYRDFKEMLIELGYYTKAEFDYLENNVLTWFIPDYIPECNPEDSGNWQDNSEEDILQYGALLNPQKVDSETGKVTQEGFTAGLDVVAPGNCKILAADVKNNTITIEFDGISQPEIGMLDKYTMIIRGIELADTIKVLDEEGVNEVEKSLQEILDNNAQDIIKAGTTIGYTSDARIQIVLKTNRGAILNNVQDYMGPTLRAEYVVGEGSCLNQIIALMKTTTSFNGVGSQVDTEKAQGVYSNHWNTIVKYSKQYGLDPYLVLAKITQECPGNGSLEEVLEHNGKGGGYGVGQFQWYENLPSGSSTYTVTYGDGSSETFELVNTDNFLNDIDLQIHLATAMFKGKIDNYGGNVLAALQAYNLGDGGLKKVVELHLGESISWDEFYRYMSDGNDIGWLNKRWEYCDTDGDGKSNRGDPNYVENVLEFYILEQ